jgi:hypothetical protein
MSTFRTVTGTPLMVAGRKVDRLNAAIAESFMKSTGIATWSEIVPRH